MVSCGNLDDKANKNVYLVKNKQYVNIGKIYKLNKKIIFVKNESTTLDINLELTVKDFKNFIKELNKKEYFYVSSPPPESYVYKTYKDEEGNERLDSKGGSWSKIVYFDDENFFFYLNNYLYDEYRIEITDKVKDFL
jgi:hypothetical protein